MEVVNILPVLLWLLVEVTYAADTNVATLKPADVTNRLLRQDIKIEQCNTKFAEFEKLIADQNRLIAEQNTKICKIENQLGIKSSSGTGGSGKSSGSGSGSSGSGSGSSGSGSSETGASSKVSTSESTQRSTGKKGTLFTIWGKDACPSKISEMVYKGYVGGSHYTHKGAAYNYLCLPEQPLWNVNKRFAASSWAYVYGAEYEQTPNKNNANWEAPCAVCRSAAYSMTTMIPARTTCLSGWKEAYKGSMRSGYYNHVASTEYVCFSEGAKRIGSNKNQNGKLMYPVRGQCGSLPCTTNGYEQNKLLACIVCMK